MAAGKWDASVAQTVASVALMFDKNAKPANPFRPVAPEPKLTAEQELAVQRANWRAFNAAMMQKFGG